MKRLTQCPSCGAPITDVKPGDINYICKYCGVSHKLDVTHIDEKINKIYSLLANLRFDEAYSHADELVMSNPKSGYAYFLRVLAANRVCYCDNDNPDWSYKKIPTLNDVQFGSITELDDVKKAIEYAETDYDREYFKKTFAYLEKVRKSAVDVIEGHKYDCDIFISVKVTQLDENGKPLLDTNGNALTTYDFAEASKLYGRLKDRYPECKIFLSENVKNEFVGLNYEPIIFAALRSAKVMILRGDSNQNINSVWVRNEWKRYLRWMRDLDDGTKRNFVFLQGNNSVTIPSDFKDLQAIKVYEMGAEQQLYTFLDNCLSEQHGKKIVGKTFDQQVAQIDGAQVTAVERKALRTYSGAQNKAVDSLIESAVYDLRYAVDERDVDERKRTRKRCFDELREILKEHPDAHKAKLYLLLEKGNAVKLEDMFLQNYPEETMQEFFDIADEKEALAAIDKVVDWFITSKFDEPNKLAKYKTGFQQACLTFDAVITPHFDYIKRDKLERLSEKMYAECELSLQKYSSNAQQKNNVLGYIDCCLKLRQYLANNDTRQYIADRVHWLKKLAGSQLDKDLKERVVKLCNEIQNAQKGNVYALWFSISASLQYSLCLPDKLFYHDDCDENYITYDVDSTEDLVYDKVNINRFKELFSYAPSSSEDKFDKKTFLRAFLQFVIDSTHTYESDSNGHLKPSKGTSDEELNGYDLFTKYIEYDLGNEELPTKPYCISTDKDGRDAGLEVCDDFSQFKKSKRTVIDDLLALFAFSLHRSRFFDEANTIYKMYLAQQDGTNGVDCILVRFYMLMCENKCHDKNEFERKMVPIKVVNLKSEILDLINSTNSGEEKANLERLRRELSDFALTHERFVSDGGKIQRMIDELPPCTVNNVNQYKEKVEEIVRTRSHLMYVDERACEFVDACLGEKINYINEQNEILPKVVEMSNGIFRNDLDGKRAWERMCNELNYKSGTTEKYPFAEYEKKLALLKQKAQYLAPKDMYDFAIKYLQQHFDEAKKDCKLAVEAAQKRQADEERRKHKAWDREYRIKATGRFILKLSGFLGIIAPKIVMAVFIALLWFVVGCDCGDPVAYDEKLNDPQGIWIMVLFVCAGIDLVETILTLRIAEGSGLQSFHSISALVVYGLLAIYFIWMFLGMLGSCSCFGYNSCEAVEAIEYLIVGAITGGLAFWNGISIF